MIVELINFNDKEATAFKSDPYTASTSVGANTNNMAALRGIHNVPIRLGATYFREMEAGDSSNSNSDESHYQLLLTALATDPPILSLVYKYDVPPSWNKWLISNHPEVLL